MEDRMQKIRKIKNGDIPLLSRVIYVMQDVMSTEKRIEWQEGRLRLSSQRITGMPGGGGTPTGIDAAYAALEEATEIQRERLNEYLRELKAAEKIINGIPSRTMRTFVTMMYVECLPPDTVRKELNMTEWGFRRARECVENAEDMAHVVWRERFILDKD